MSSRQLTQPLLNRLYHRYLRDEDTPQFVARVAERYTISTLHRMAVSNDRITRRAAVMALGFLADYASNACLGRALRDDDRGVRMLAENGLGQIWFRQGTAAQQGALHCIVRQISACQFERAADEATRLIDQSPWLAEAWHQRAIAHFQMQCYQTSIEDSRRALCENTFHFHAAVGMGQAHLKLDDPITALSCFRIALRLNPDLDAVRAQVHFLQRILEQG